jgi:hypothetical protein
MSTNTYGYDVQLNGIYYNLNPTDKTAEVTYKDDQYGSYSGEIKIPTTISHNGVTYTIITIGTYAFKGCSGLISVKIPNSVTTIKYCAFANCSGLTSIDIPNSVTSIGGGAFSGCIGLTNICIPNSVISIGGYAFSYCNGLSSITISNSISSIEIGTFHDCIGLTSITIPNSVTSIGQDAFNGCTGLTSINIPKSVTSMGFYAFDGCKSLNSVHIDDLVAWCNISFVGQNSNPLFFAKHLYLNGVEIINDLTIPNSVNSIAGCSFSGCIGITSVTIPNSVTTIGDYAFSPCSNLELVRSYIENPFEIKDVFRISSSAKLEVPKGTKKQYQDLSGWANCFKEIIEMDENPTTCTLSIIASGNGSVSYIGTTIRDNTSSFVVDKGASATISFLPDDGYRIKKVLVNNSIVTVSVSVLNNQYTVYINSNTTVKVEFEKIPADSEGAYNTYITCAYRSSHITKTGSVVQNSVNFEVMNSGNKSIYITKLVTKDPDTKEVLATSTDKNILGELEGGTMKTYSVSLNKDIIPIWEITYTYDNKEYSYDNTQYVLLYITANKYGVVKFLDTSVGEKTMRYSIMPESDAIIEFVPEKECVLSKLSINGTEMTSSILDNKYTISKISSSIIVSAIFDKTSGNNQSINGHEFVDLGLPSGKYWSTVNYGANKPEDAGYYLRPGVFNEWGDYWKAPTKEEMQELIDECVWTWTELNGMNGFDIKGPNGNSMFLPAAGQYQVIDYYSVGSIAYYTTSSYDGYSYYWIFEGSSTGKQFVQRTAMIDSYPIRPISTVKNESVFSTGGLNFSVISSNEKTANLAKGNYGKVLEVPVTVKYPSTEWKIVGIDKGALSECDSLAAVIWNPEFAFTENVDNPNMLLYVKSASYAPSSIKNVVVNGAASSIVLSDASGKNDFYCPKEFTAKTVNYMHHYTMETGIGNARGWETIALPFDVQKITHQSKGEIVPFANWKSGDAKKPFWLMTYGSSGWVEANSIKANAPYIISMPNHSNYKSEFRLNGNVSFSAENVTIPPSDNLLTSNYNGRTFSPNYANQSDNSYYALNVNNDYVTYSGNDLEGSKFLIGLRTVHPFEAYMTSASQARMYIAIDEDMTTGIGDITEIMANEKVVRVYNLNGQLIMEEENKSVDEIQVLLSAGVYIVNGKKLIIK